jgi:hypothetical protein
MSDDHQILKTCADLPPNERAAALGHIIYSMTLGRSDNTWQSRVPKSWAELDVEPKRFNILTIDTWIEHPELLKAWIDAVLVYRDCREGGSRAGPAR